MKNTTAVLLMALGLTLPATTFAQNADPAPRPAIKPPAQRKMTVSDEARPAPATPAKAVPVAATLANPPATPGNQRQRPVPALIAAVDVNHDRVLDAAEIANASESLRKLDKNGDGTLTAEEVPPQRASRSRPMPSAGAETGASEAAPRPPSRARLGALDANHDGVIDAAEISGASQLLAQLDKDGDGKVTLDELRSQRAATPGTARRSTGTPKE